VLPVAWGFSLIIGKNLDMVFLEWFTFIIAEGVSVVIALIFMKKIRRKRIDTL
jgi:hypothetical protein